MSADNWRECPKCKKEIINKRNEKIDFAAKQYGTISQKEYEELRDEAMAPLPEVEETFREDYEIFTGPLFDEGEDKVFLYVDYIGKCQACGFGKVLQIKEELDVESNDNII